MTKPVKTKKSLVKAHLNSGKGITFSIAKSKFAVKNLRATISDLVLTESMNIRSTVDKKTGETRYSKVKG